MLWRGKPESVASVVVVGYQSFLVRKPVVAAIKLLPLNSEKYEVGK